jgi:16S rRNA (cytosine1402-N4)-methyltransferase
MPYQHEPVLLQEALQFLDPKSGQNFVDATLGGGAYSLALLEAVAPQGRVLSIDLDQEALRNYQSVTTNHKQQKNAIMAQGNFADLDKIVVNHQFGNIQGIVADIGLSSFQLDASDRGISFQKDEPLDMRFDLSDQGSDARFIVNNFSEEELIKIFREYGEEPFAKQIARNVVKVRSNQPLQRTSELVEVIKASLPKPKQHAWASSARRIFQALRIAVNHELENLQAFLPKALDLLSPAGRLVVITFHSLEDRLVKQFFTEASKGCICPPDFPYCQCGRSPAAKILTRKPVTASVEELEKNPRSKPAKLRALQKL